jgi:hypothetical protein
MREDTVHLNNAEVPPGRRRLALGITVVPGRDEAWCTTRLGDQRWHGTAASQGHRQLTPGRYELILLTPEVGPVHGIVRLQQLRLTGLEALAPDADAAAPGPAAVHEIQRALTNRDPSHALGLLAGPVPGLSPDRIQMLRFVALDDLGRWSEAEAALRAALGVSGGARGSRCTGLAGMGQLTHELFRIRPERVSPALRRACAPEAYHAAVWGSWELAVGHHPDEEAVHRMLVTQLGDIEVHEPAADQLVAYIELLRGPARGWAAQGVSGAARADLQRAMSVAGAFLRAGGHDARLVDSVTEQLAHCGRELAGTLTSEGDHDGAIAELRRALSLTREPETLADQIAVQPELRDLHDRPAWREMITAARAGRRPPTADPGASPPP